MDLGKFVNRSSVVDICLVLDTDVSWKSYALELLLNTYVS